LSASKLLRHATYEYLATQILSKDEIEKLTGLFKALDTNNDGTLSLEELKEGYCSQLGKIMSDSEFAALFKRA
jgi:Ca2+-binding EF-hand superfamily protein